MGIFSRKPRDGPAAHTATTHSKHHNDKGTPYYSMSSKPSFGQWLKHTWLDIATMIVMGAIGLGVSRNSQIHYAFHFVIRYLHMAVVDSRN